MKGCKNIILPILVFLLRLKFLLALQSPILKDGQTFDFIVVGGGTGGCVVAARLAETGKYSVLVIQEGGVANENLNIPALITNGFPNELKHYDSLPQKNSHLDNNGIVRFTIGKSIGGGSSVNGKGLNRGHPQDYDNWAEILKDNSWNYENMLPFFKKIENYRGFNPTEQRGFGGPISIENRNDMKYGVAEFIDAGNELGYPFGDGNGPQTPCVTIFDYSRFRGRRVSSFSGYIGPLLSSAKEANSEYKMAYGYEEESHNLVILLNTEAKRLIFEGDKVVGVTFVSLNSSQLGFAKAKKEVILSAGVMDSPAILMRSGIGPKSVLDRAGISVVKYLEGVGKNLQDHVGLRQPIILGNRSMAFIPSRDLTPEAWKEFEAFGTGAYEVYGGGGGQGFFSSTLQSASDKPWPDLQFVPYHLEIPFPGIKEDEVAVAWGLLSIRNKSRGTVTLNVTNIDNPPLIDFNFLDHPDDMRALLDIFKLAEVMCQKTTAMRRIHCRLPTTPISACKDFKLGSEAYHECSIRQLSGTTLHAAGTCKMGRIDDPEAVVDSKLKVIGIQNLRIADASVMPVVTNANTQGPVYGIAERAADMILKQWNSDPYSLIDFY